MLKQGPYCIEFYLREGRLLCIGPVRTNASLGDRLLADKVISLQALQEIRLSLAPSEQSETRVALALMDMGYVSREDLRAWAMQKAIDVLRAVLVWNAGDIYFEDATPPPTDRLLVAMPISTLLAAATLPEPAPLPAQPMYSTQPQQSVPSMPNVYSPVVQAKINEPSLPPQTPSPSIERIPTLMDAAQFLNDSPIQSPSLGTAQFLNDGPAQPQPTFMDAAHFLNDSAVTSLPSTEALSPIFAAADDTMFPSLLSDADSANFASLNMPLEEQTSPEYLMRPEPVADPIPPKRIDVSFMRPEMVLIPADLSAFRQQNPQLQLTPQQWSILSRADGKTSLKAICQEFGISSDLVCLVAGELVAEGLIYVSLPGNLSTKELSPISRELLASGMGNGYVSPGYAAAIPAPWSGAVPALPTSDVLSPFTNGLPFETESQWGNGGNGATFIPGRGWVTSPQPLQPLQSNIPPGSGIYAQVSMNGYGR
jgi:hypothetical protein